MKHQRLSAALALGTTLSISHAALADNQYQFALNAVHSQLNLSSDYEPSTNDSHGEINAIGATIYLEPVHLNNNYHQNVAAFYQRASGLSLSASEGQYRELTIIRSGRGLRSIEFGNKQASIFGSFPDSPLWLEGDYVDYDEEKYEFTAGPSATGQADNTKALTAGFFLHPDHSFFVRYSDAYMDGFGGGFRSYFHLNQGMGLEFGGYIERVKSDEEPSLVVVENTIRNADLGQQDSVRTWQTHLAFFPHRDVSISVVYGKTEHSEEVKEERMGSELKYFVTPNVNVGIGHHENHLSNLGLRLGNLQYEQYYATLGLRF